MTALRPSAVALLLANLAPLAGVLFLDWQVFDILMLYWAENVVIGVINVLRMIASRPKLGVLELAENRSGLRFSDTQRRQVAGFTSGFRFFLVPFFVVHYGMFCFGHYTAVVSLFGREGQAEGAGLFGTSLADAWQSPLWLGIAAIAISHLVSFYFNFIGQREYQRTNLMQLMTRPYGRIIVLHITVIAGGFLVTLLGDATWMIVALVLAKSGIDLRMHERERVLLGVSKSVG